MKLSLYHVDAFANAPFTGNPAAVVLLDDWPPDGVMQAVAAQNNLSETAFVRPAGKYFALRWFTPRLEVPICGHATLAAAYVLRQFYDAGDDIAFDTRSGPLRVTAQSNRYTLDFPAVYCTPSEPQTGLTASALGAPPAEIHQTEDRYLCLFAQAQTIRDLQPDMAAIATLPLPGLIVTAPGDGSHDFVSRYFAPRKGVPEDPVTGAAHCVLAPFWADRLGRRKLCGYQASARGGEVDCEVAGDRVLMSGPARLYLRGQIDLGDAVLPQA